MNKNRRNFWKKVMLEVAIVISVFMAGLNIGALIMRAKYGA